MCFRFPFPALLTPALALATWLLVPAPNAQAHQPGLSYLLLSWNSTNGLTGRIDMSLRDLEFTVGLDRDGNGSVTYEELTVRQDAIGQFIESHLLILGNGRTASVQVARHEVATDQDGVYAVAHLAITGLQAIRRLKMDYRLFVENDPNHRGLMQFDYFNEEPRLAVFRSGATEYETELDPAPQGPPPATPSLSSTNDPTQTTLQSPPEEATDPLPSPAPVHHPFWEFLREGVRHIWIGIDHILFLIALLLPAVLRRTPTGEWEGVPSLRPALANVIQVVTAFTVAHSITLTLARLGVVHLNIRLVESIIAVSVIIAAVNNLRPIFPDRVWLVAFGFGLMHGFGFASVFGKLPLPDSALVWTLLAFNIGVELGQLAIVLMFVPLAYKLRNRPFYRRQILVGGSACIAALATLWFIERAFEVDLAGILKNLRPENGISLRLPWPGMAACFDGNGTSAGRPI